MHKDTEEQILEELKGINQTLVKINERDKNKKQSIGPLFATILTVSTVIIFALIFSFNELKSAIIA